MLRIVSTRHAALRSDAKGAFDAKGSFHFASQDKPSKGALIYGRVMGIDGPLAGIHVTEENAWLRIMAEGVTDENGEFSFRLTNPENRIVISSVGYETIDLGIDKQHYEISMKNGITDTS